MQGNLGLRNLPAETNFTFQNTLNEFFKGSKKKICSKTRAVLNSVILISITTSAWAPRCLSATPGTRVNCNCTLIPLSEADVVPRPSFFVIRPLCWEPYGSILWMNFMPLKVSQAVWRGCLLSHSRSIWKHWHLVTVWSEMTIEKSWRAGGVSMSLQGLEILKRLLHLLPFFICLLHHSPFGGPAAASVSRFTWPLKVFRPWVSVHLAADSHCYPSNKGLIV